jgi:hypothetical protein
MATLRELQQGFMKALYDGDDDLAARLVPRGPGGGRDRLRLYRNSVFGILTDALAAVYPVVQRLVGERFFAFAARAFIPKHPSHTGDLHAYGEWFPAFLATFAPAGGLPYLADVARLEWACHRAFHAAEAPTLDLARLAAVAPTDHATLRLRLAPAATVLTSSYPIHRIWAANQPGSPEQNVDLGLGGVHLLVTRHGFEITQRPLAPAECAFLHHLAVGDDLEAACRAADAAGADPGQLLLEHVRQGTLVDLVVG